MTFERFESNYRQSNTVQPPARLREILNQEGFRLTEQRQKILAIFRKTPEGEHLSAEDIYQQLSDSGEKIGFSTIYRALHVMVNLGLIRELELAENRKFYELSGSSVEQHHHLVCVRCGEVSEFEAQAITSAGSTEAVTRGFALLNCQFTVHGLCPACQNSLAE